ncbi:hypothetical protein M1L60_42510 [Actinoplanes sp. TRM 88003]|uniref:Uncharacterized protein n=1 Tax=Paractinoplanes aksuensis TaxID=2939490 RepID=A0ABT1E537_9ACTN|nr:hypothetical protein [Actinoplanes aksuensis]MCO8277270.1 hypothetical protein [Actinoplanes aksuensis]
MTTVLRRTPAGNTTRWELADIAAPPGTPALGTAVTRTGADGVTRLLELTPPLSELVCELVAALRRTGATALELPADEPQVLAGLCCEDFEHVGPHLLVRF